MVALSLGSGWESDYPVMVYLVASIVMAVSIFMCFCGRKFFRTCLGIVGFVFGSIIALMFLALLALWDINYSPVTDLIILLCMGTLGAVLSCLLFKWGLFVLGCFAGYALALVCMAPFASWLSDYSWLQFILYIAFIILGCVLVFFMETPVVITATAIGGALGAFMALDVFLNTGFADAIWNSSLTQANNAMESMSAAEIYMFVGMICLAVVGIVVQSLLVGCGRRE